MPSPTRRPRRRLTLLLALAVALAPIAAATAAFGQGTQAGAQDQDRYEGSENGTENGSDANDSSTGSSDSNDSRTQPAPSNGSQAENGNRSHGADAREDRSERDERPRSPPGRADPVQIRETARGFSTQAPPDSPRPTVAVDASNGSARVERPDVQPLDVRFDTLVEFSDEDGDGRYDVGEPVVERFALRSTPHRIVPDRANATRTVAYELGNTSQLSLVFDLGTDHAEQVATKLDVVVEGYDFESPNTRIALGSQVEVEGGVEHTTRDGRPVVAGQQGDEVSYLSWAPTVAVDGEQRAVASSVHVDAAEPTESAVVYWAYPQGERIVHDPTLGVQDAIRDLAGALTPFALGLAATLGLLGVGYAARTRWHL